MTNRLCFQKTNITSAIIEYSQSCVDRPEMLKRFITFYKAIGVLIADNERPINKVLCYQVFFKPRNIFAFTGMFKPNRYDPKSQVSRLRANGEQLKLILAKQANITCEAEVKAKVDSANNDNGRVASTENGIELRVMNK